MPADRSRAVLFIALLPLLFAAPVFAQSPEREIVAYFPEWGVHLQPYYVKDMVGNGSASRLTVLNYAFAIPAPDGNGNIACRMDDPYAAYRQVYDAGMSVDGSPDSAVQSLRGHFNQLRKLKLLYPDLKIMVAIGGWTGSTYWSDAALTAGSRQAFVASCIDMFIQGNLPAADGAGGPGAAAGIFDGFDIDWEYPVTGGDGGTRHNSSDDVNLTATLAEFRRQMDAVDPELLLTMAAPGSAFRGDNFQIGEDQHYLDWLNLMTYDFHGGWEKKTGHLTNLLTSPDDPSSTAFKLSLDNAVRLYRDTYGVPADKLVPGAAFYGLGWKNVSSTNDGLYQSGQEAPGIYEDGYNYYRDLIPLLSQGYSPYWDEHALASWLYSPSTNIFWTLDEPQSLALKRRYVDAYALRGIMFWEISGDDASGTLLRALDTGAPGGFVSGDSMDAGIGVEITRPVDCAISLEGFNVVVNAAAGAPGKDIVQVEFFQGATSLGYDNRPPWSWAWFNLPAGNHELTAVATDSAGGFKRSDAVNITVYGRGSGLGLWEAGESYQTGDEVFYEGCIYSARRIHVGSRVRTPENSRYWDLVTCSECGSGGGGNQVPSIEIVSPPDNSGFSEGESIAIAADAGDPDGVVERVDFWANDTLLDSDTTEPYAYTWADVAAGSYQMRAVAFDDMGDSAQDSVHVTVATPGGCTLPAWEVGTTYQKGDQVQHNTIRWKAKRTSQGVEPGTSPSRWTNLGVCAE